MPTFFKKDRGYTLVELLVAVGILWIVLGGIYTLFIGGEDIWDIGDRQIEAQRSARVAMLRIAQELRECYEVTALSEYSLTLRGIQVSGEVLAPDTSTNPLRTFGPSAHSPWIQEAAPTIYRAGTPRPSSDYSVDYADGKVTFNDDVTDEVTADYTHDETLTISLSNGSLIRTTSTTSTVLAEYITNESASTSVFVGDKALPDTRLITTILIVDRDPTKRPAAYTLENKCRLRKK
ncbi:MAG: prepilin-type N-terminal cleavage/methylation domain-containing protein [Actinomycetota bacterium]|nr:prepilin-type N-terminal cleavage/methylation domain-containing protein [Actinomycetota bacterium]